MKEAIPFFYFLICMIVVATDLSIAMAARKRGTSLGKIITHIAVFGIWVTISTLASVNAKSYVAISIWNSLTFIGVDFLVICLFMFAIYFSDRQIHRRTTIFVQCLQIYAIVETIEFLINPFYEFVVGYEITSASLSSFHYIMHAPFYLHLSFCYMMIVLSLMVFISKMIKLPKEYRKPYYYVLLGIVVVVAINALWLFAPKTHLWNEMDYSVWGYSIATYFLYWTCFQYSTHGMVDEFRSMLVDSLEQGIVLFDIKGHEMLHNERLEDMLPAVANRKELVIEDLDELLKLDVKELQDFAAYTMQCFIEENGVQRPLRCDYRRMINASSETLGYLFMFSDATLEIDLLTGFHSLDGFRTIASERSEIFNNQCTVVVMDIIGLKAINYAEGRTAGDGKIRELSQVMRAHFPKDTFFVRGQDANLFAICRNMDEARTKQLIEEVQEAFQGTCQYAVNSNQDEGVTMEEALETAERSLRARKLLDKQSRHSSMLTSLLVALQECDPDTEKHVERTQKMGAALGKKLGLTDIQLSDLSLLCILHDIGKIGVPLEILNKPAKLTDAEWVIMRSHVEKGYQIATSSEELEGIAEMIRYHHERWDGKGYPDGLAGEEIPILSRIISIVDAYDAMINDRIYRPAMAPEKAQAELKRCAGTQFDPQVVDEFVKMLQEPEFKSESDEISRKVAVREAAERRQERSMKAFLKAGNGEGKITPLEYARYVLSIERVVLEADDVFCRLTGYTQEEIAAGKVNQQDLFLPEDYREYLETMATAIRSGRYSAYQYDMVRKDGSRIEVACTGKKFYDSTDRCEKGEMMIMYAGNME